MIKSWLDPSTDVHNQDSGRRGWSASMQSPKGVSPQGESPQGVEEEDRKILLRAATHGINQTSCRGGALS